MSLYALTMKAGKPNVVDLFTRKKVPKQEAEDVLRAIKEVKEIKKIKKEETSICFLVSLN